MAKTVKVRIAVAVTDEGEWDCGGGCGQSDEATMNMAAFGAYAGAENKYWLTAELAVPEAHPEPVEVAAAVEPAAPAAGTRGES